MLRKTFFSVAAFFSVMSNKSVSILLLIMAFAVCETQVATTALRAFDIEWLETHSCEGEVKEDAEEKLLHSCACLFCLHVVSQQPKACFPASLYCFNFKSVVEIPPELA